MSAFNDLVPELRPFADFLVDEAGKAGLQPRVTSTRRSTFKQVRLYLRFLAGRSDYPVALPGTSAHEYGEAFDIIVTPYDYLGELGRLWQEMGGTWGGARDPIHFELPGASASHRVSPRTHTIAEAVDFVLAFIPYLGAVQLVAALTHMGYPESQILEFLSGPAAFLTK